MSDQTTILVVDDVPTNVRLLEAVLVSQGYVVISASEGQATDSAVGSIRESS